MPLLGSSEEGTVMLQGSVKSHHGFIVFTFMFTTGGSGLQLASLDRESIQQSGQDSLKSKTYSRTPLPNPPMKASIVTTMAAAALLAATVSSQAQGTVNFANGNNYITLVYNGSKVTGSNAYLFGLYLGAVGAQADTLTLVATATNAAPPFAAGQFNGGNQLALPTGWTPGSTYEFQVRGWTFGDPSYEAALVSNNPNSINGVSGLGTVTLGGGIAFPGELFGTGPGRVGGFALGIIPEPTTLALGGLGAAGLLFFRRRK
jgi:hypothetical protein